MQLTLKQLRKLRAEAKQTYLKYGAVRELHRGDRDNAEIRREMIRLRTRYKELERLLNDSEKPQSVPGLDEADGSFHIEGMQSGPIRPFATVGPPLGPDDPGFLSRALWMGKKARIVFSVAILIVAILILLLISSQRLGFYIVPSASMEPTLLPDDRLVAYSNSRYERGEVVVIRDPQDPQAYLVKRIVAVGGDTVAVENGMLLVNGQYVSEPYLRNRIEYKLPRMAVREGKVFLLGDNRNNSSDSHIWRQGVNAEDIMGSVRMIYSPKSRRGTQIAYTASFANLK